MRFLKQIVLTMALAMGAGSFSCTREKPKDATCDLLVRGTSIQYNGRALPLPGSLTAWEQVFGKHSRMIDTSSNVYVWDEAGVYAIAPSSDEALQSFAVVLHSNTDPFRGAPQYWPKSTFKGRLCVDGSDITPSSRIEDVNRTKQGQPFSRGYLDRIYSYDIIQSPRSVYVRIDLTDEGTPESFYMGFAEETK
ncbi:DUF7738 domain-containing protein [Cystobacter fuscus]|uniref:DUF7738 domain-containing protein n=1 Tax=Cystobacter fuscus TaxID=43 RepID=UPI0005B8BD9A|nr:hypothetical protein [Cystobacter fuscus]